MTCGVQQGRYREPVKKSERWEAAQAASHRPSLCCYGIVTLLAEQQEPFPETEMTW